MGRILYFLLLLLLIILENLHLNTHELLCWVVFRRVIWNGFIWIVVEIGLGGMIWLLHNNKFLVAFTLILCFVSKKGLYWSIFLLLSYSNILGRLSSNQVTDYYYKLNETYNINFTLVYSSLFWIRIFSWEYYSNIKYYF